MTDPATARTETQEAGDELAAACAAVSATVRGSEAEREAIARADRAIDRWKEVCAASITFQALNGGATRISWPDGFFLIEPGDLWRDRDNREAVAEYLRATFLERHPEAAP